MINLSSVFNTKEQSYFHFDTRQDLWDWLEKNSTADGTVTSDVVMYDEVSLKAAGEYMVMSDSSKDDQGERVEPNGWVLERYKTNPILLWQHDQSRPAIGRMEDVKVVDGKLIGRPVFDPEATDPFAGMIAKKFAAGTIRAGSVGFKPLRIEKRMVNGVSELWIVQQELGEFSIVNLPSNKGALHQRVKSAGPEEEDEEEETYLDEKGADGLKVITQAPEIKIDTTWMNKLIEPVEKRSRQSSDLENLFSTLGIDSLFHQKAAKPKRLELRPISAKTKFEWVLDPDPSVQHCEDCASRDGKVKTMRQWMDLGLPQDEEALSCGIHCKCQLAEVDDDTASEDNED